MRLLSISFLLGILCTLCLSVACLSGMLPFINLSEVAWLADVVTHANDVSPYFIILFITLALLSLHYLWKYRLFIGILSGFVVALWSSTAVTQTQLDSSLEGKNLMVRGTVSSIPYQRGNGWRFRLKINTAQLLDEPDKPLSLSGNISLGWYKTEQTLHAGEKWQMVVRLKRPSGFMNPGGFDYEKWLFHERIIATGYVRQSQDNKRISKPAIYSINAIRENILNGIKQHIKDPSQAAIVSALAVAERNDISDQQWQVLRQTGTNHLVAISGLHIGLVAGFGFFPVLLMWWLFPRLYHKMPVRIAGGLAGAILAIVYALLAGFTLPTQRALIMVLVVLVGMLARKQFSNSSILATALMAVLIFDPLAVLSSGLWLSFVAVGIIIFTLARRKGKQRFAFDIITTQLALSLGMLPLTLALFGTGSLSSPLANLIAIPWVSFLTVPLTLLGILWMPISAVSSFLLNLAALSVDYLFRVLGILSSSKLMVSMPEIPTHLLLIAFLGLVWVWLPAKFPARWLGLLLILPLLLYRTTPVEQGAFKYDLLDVGQGLASVIQTKNHVLLYDTGPRASANFDTGKLVVLPFLRARNISHIDTMMISHEDLDHRGGAKFIKDHITVTTIMSSDTGLFTGTVHCDQYLKWVWDNVVFEVLHPDKYWPGSDNDRSCILRVYNQHHSLLLTGDIQKVAEYQLIKSGQSLRSEVMLVPHHGSKTSSSVRFLNAVKPQLALVAAGYRNRFHFPNKQVMKRYEYRDIKVLNTAETGAISLYFPKSSEPYKVESYRQLQQNYWNRQQE